MHDIEQQAVSQRISGVNDIPRVCWQSRIEFSRIIGRISNAQNEM
jgi:hypothetical protein